MTFHQNMAIWEMLCQGLHQLASQAEQRWEQGEEVQRDDSIHVSRVLWMLVERGNRELRPLDSE